MTERGTYTAHRIASRDAGVQWLPRCSLSASYDESKSLRRFDLHCCAVRRFGRSRFRCSTTGTRTARTGRRRERAGTFHDLVVIGQRSQRHRRVQLAGQLLVELYAGRPSELHQWSDHRRHRERPRQRHVLLARAGGERRVRTGRVVGRAKLQRDGRGARRAGDAVARTAEGIFDVPSVRGHDLQLDRRGGRCHVRVPGGDRSEFSGRHADPVRQHPEHNLLVRDRQPRRQLLRARPRRERERRLQRAVERHLVLRLLQQPCAAGADSVVSARRRDAHAADHPDVVRFAESAAERL